LLSFTNFTAVNLGFYSLNVMNSSKILAFIGVQRLRALQEREKEGERKGVRKGGRQSVKKRERDLEKVKVRKGRDRVRKRERNKEAQ
jgi:hypothetical protein